MRTLRVGFAARAILAFAATALTGSGAAWAQTVPGGAPPAGASAGLSAPELNPAARVPRLQTRETDVFQPEPPGPCPLASSDVQVTLGR
jgi:hypothetical protein